MTITEFLVGALTGGVITYVGKSVYDNHKRERARANFVSMYNAKQAAKANSNAASGTGAHTTSANGCSQVSGTPSTSGAQDEANTMSNLVILSI
jgi:hypothetical protein